MTLRKTFFLLLTIGLFMTVSAGLEGPGKVLNLRSYMANDGVTTWVLFNVENETDQFAFKYTGRTWDKLRFSLLLSAKNGGNSIEVWNTGTDARECAQNINAKIVTDIIVK